MNRSIGRRIAGVVGASAMLGLTAGGADALSSAHRHYSGRTAQGRALTVTVRAGRITYDTSFRQRCYKPTHASAGPTDGMVHIERRFVLRNHPHGRFSLRFSQGRTRVTPPIGQRPTEYFTAIYTATGRLGRRSARGMVSAVSTYHTLRGAVLGTCRTGALRWSAKRTS